MMKMAIPDSDRTTSYEFRQTDDFLTDEVLDELKKQATSSCVLCALEELDEEEWD